MWGIQKCQEKILFLKEKTSFWAFKNSVHLGLKEQIFTRFCFDWFGGCRSPNQERFSFLESYICLVCFPKISANESLYFGSYRSWSEVCSQEIRTRVTNFAIFVWVFPIIKQGLSCVQAKEVKDKDWAQQSGKYGTHLQHGTKRFYKTCSMRIVC